MKKNEVSLSVEERVRAVLHLKVMENNEKELTVSELCRLAGVSRATLYQHHPELLTEVRSKLGVRTRVGAAKSKSNLKVTSVSFEPQLKSLLYLCLELQMEVRSLKAMVPPPRKK